MVPWRQTDSVDDLGLRRAGMVVTILSVFFLTAVLEWEGAGGLLGFGLAIASVIAAVALYLYPGVAPSGAGRVKDRMRC